MNQLQVDLIYAVAECYGALEVELTPDQTVRIKFSRFQTDHEELARCNRDLVNKALDNGLLNPADMVPFAGCYKEVFNSISDFPMPVGAGLNLLKGHNAGQYYLDVAWD